MQAGRVSGLVRVLKAYAGRGGELLSGSRLKQMQATGVIRAEMDARNGLKRLAELVPELKALRASGLRGRAFAEAADRFGKSRVQPVVESTRDALIRRLHEIGRRHSFDDANRSSTWKRVARFGSAESRRNTYQVLDSVVSAMKTPSGGTLGDRLADAFESGYKYLGRRKAMSIDGIGDIHELISLIPGKLNAPRLDVNPISGAIAREAKAVRNARIAAGVAGAAGLGGAGYGTYRAVSGSGHRGGNT